MSGTGGPGPEGPGPDGPGGPVDTPEPSGLASALPTLSIQRPVTVVMILAALLVVGLVATTRIPLQLNPSNFEFPFLYAVVPYPNANPSEIEATLARPVEQALGTVRNLTHLTSWSRSDQLGVFLQFQQDTDMALAYQEVRDRLDRVETELPDEVRRTYLLKFDPNDDPVVWIGAALRDGDDGSGYGLLRDRVVRPLERIEGVAKVELYGIEEPYFLIELDNEAARAHSVDLQALYEMLRGSSFTLASGHVDEGGRRLLVRSLAEFETVEQIRAMVVPRWAGERAGRPDDPTEHAVRLGDVATVSYGSPLPGEVIHVDGRDGLSLGVYREASANTVEVCERIQAVLDGELRTDPHLSGVDLTVYFSEAEVILASLGTLGNAGLIGAVFAVGILFLFLGRVRLTLVIALAIPLSLLISLTVMYFSGETLNLISLMGMLVAVGLVVDCPIVVMENIHRRRLAGEAPRAAAARGAAEVALAVTMGTLTTVVAFLPIILMPGNAILKYFLAVFGLPICWTILASLGTALVFVPLVTVLLPLHEVKSGGGPLLRLSAGFQRRLVEPVRRGLTRAALWALGRRLEASLLLLVVFALGMSLGGLIKSSDDMEGNIRDLTVRLEMPPGATREDVHAVMDVAEPAVLAAAEELDIRSLYTEGDERAVELRIFLEPADQSDLTVPDVQERLKAILPPIAGVRVRHGRQGQDEERAATSVVLYGDDTEVLMVLAGDIEKRLAAIPGVVETETSLEHGDEEIRLRLDRDLLQAYGVGVQAVTGIVSTTLRGAPLPDYHVAGRQVPMRFRLSPRNRQTVHQLVATPVPADSGTEIALGAFSRLERARGLPVVMRRDGLTMMRVTARTNEKDVEKLMRQVDAVMAPVRLPDGYRWDKSDRFNLFEEGSGAEGFAVVMSVCFIFILMGVLFESWLLPVSVMLSVPFAFVGINVALVTTATPRDLLAGIGSVLLVGLVVNNAIVLVDCVNRHRLAGCAREDAIRRALEERFRPIVLTALTTLFGVLPMAIGGTEIVGIPFAPLGRVIFGGLLASTVSTVVVVPLFYTLFDDLAGWLSGFRSWAVRALPAFAARRWVAMRRPSA